MSSPRHAAPGGPAPGDRLVRVGALLFGLGVIGVVAAFVPFLVLDAEAPLWPALVTLLLPLGLGLALLGLLRGARARRRTTSHD